MLEVERRVDVPEEDPAAGLELSRPAGGDEARRRAQLAPEPRAHRPVGRVRDGEDDGEHAVGPLAEVAREDDAGAVGVGSGHGERVGEQSRQPDRGGDADGEDGEPAEQDRHAKAEDGSGPALGHGLTIVLLQWMLPGFWGARSDARTQGAPVAVATGATEDAAARSVIALQKPEDIR